VSPLRENLKSFLINQIAEEPNCQNRQTAKIDNLKANEPDPTRLAPLAHQDQT
jgi:hypothetical protein